MYIYITFVLTIVEKKYRYEADLGHFTSSTTICS